MKRFAKTVRQVLKAYSDLLKGDFPKIVKDERQACAVMNNVQQTRIQLEKTYLSMGGKELQEDAGPADEDPAGEDLPEHGGQGPAGRRR